MVLTLASLVVMQSVIDMDSPIDWLNNVFLTLYMCCVFHCAMYIGISSYRTTGTVGWATIQDTQLARRLCHVCELVA